MTNGLGAALFGVVLLGVLLAIAGLLGVVAGVSLYWRQARIPVLLQYVALGLVGVAVLVAGFGIAVLVDEAAVLAVLFGGLVGVPVLLVAGRARWTGASWVTVAAITGMAWSVPFLVGMVVLVVVQNDTAASATVSTAVGGLVTTAGALLIGEYFGGLQWADTVLGSG